MGTILIGNQHQSEKFGPSLGRTGFQTAYVMAVAAQPDFDFFCGNPACDEPYRGPFALVYYSKDGALHVDWVGQKRVVRRHTA